MNKRQMLIKDKRWLTLEVLVLTIVPALALYYSPTIGIYVNASALVTLAGLALLYEPARKIAVATAVPLVSFTLLMSLPAASNLVRATWFYGAILLLSLAYRYLFTHNDPTAKKHRAAPRNYLTALPQGLAVGAVLGWFAFLLLPHSQPFGDVSVGLVVGLMFAFACIETIYFQGLLQASAAETLSPMLGVVVAAGLFAGLGAAATVPSIALGLLAGGSFALLYYFKQNILPAMLANASMKLVFVYLLFSL